MEFKRVKRSKKLFKIFLIILLVFNWTFGGWPVGVKKVKAVPTVVILTSADTSPWDVPSDWNNTNTVEVVGGGGGGAGGTSGGGALPGDGGGGGAYAKTANIALTPGGTANFQIGTVGSAGSAAGNGGNAGDTWFDGTGTNCASQSVCGDGGLGGATGNGGVGTGGTLANSIGGAQEYIGGDGGTDGAIGGGGGGAGGLNGNGATASGTTGGNGDAGSGGSGGTAGKPGGSGGDGTEWTTAGSGGGGGGGDKGAGGPGGNSGGGGGGGDNGQVGAVGTEGVIVITYEPVAATILTQDDFRWYEDETTVTLTNLWGTVITGDNEDVTAVPVAMNPPAAGDKLRLQINLTVTGLGMSAGAQDFILEYKAGTDQDCSTGSWTAMGAIGASGTAWRFYDNTSLTHGDPEVNQISTSDIVGDYVESDPTQTNANVVAIGESIEWDFAIEPGTTMSDATTYAFRLIQGGTGSTVNYTAGDCPSLETAPGTANQLKHGNFFVDGIEKGFFWTN